LPPAQLFLPQWRELGRNASYNRFRPRKHGRAETENTITDWQAHMARLIKALFLLAILGFLGLVGFAYLGDLGPVPSEVRQPVDLNANQ
jgi:hypothetical protein